MTQTIRERGSSTTGHRNNSIRALQGRGMMIYAARNKAGLIKIGASTDVVERLRHIGGLAEILALKPGERAEELAIHRALSEHAAKGREYYHPTPEVLAVVNGMREELGLSTLTA